MRISKWLKKNIFFYANIDLGAVASVNIDAYDTGEELANEVSKTINMPIGMFKLVSAGSVVKNDVRLNQQNLKPGQTVMVLTVDHGGSKAMQIVNEQRKILSTAKADAERLGSRDQMTITVIYLFKIGKMEIT